ncbi:TRAP transporter large permease subunit [Sedimentitalea sp. XS_ASV28]|uniref:TRAP transporter large permease n=1 Tax=Sedimentitalea sp. XS_ASV28 TaxID=3241296 RepID=UPI00351364AF
MLDLIAHNLAPLMFFVVMGLLLLGYPVAFTLAAGGLVFFAIGVLFDSLTPDIISLSWPMLNAQPDRIFGIISNDTLLAVPFFTLMGALFEKTGIAEDLLGAVAKLFGPLRGGLCFAVILVGTIMGATTGVVSASVMTMGLIALPIMMRSGYDHRIAAGTVTSAGTLSQIVPPSLVLIVMADQIGKPVGDMYHAALVPSAMMIGLYVVFIAAVALFFSRTMPAMQGANVRRQDYLSLVGMILFGTAAGYVTYHSIDLFGTDAGRLMFAVAIGAGALMLATVLAGHYCTPLTRRTVHAIVPTLGLIFLVLGTIFLGIATPTESGSLGAVGAMLLALARGRLGGSALTDALRRTAQLTIFVYFILIGARLFSLTFYGLDGDRWLHGLLMMLPGERMGFIIFSMVLIFILGCFLDFFEIAFIVVPLLLPTAAALDVDLLWFGILISINLQTSFLTAPFGFALFYLRSVVDPPGPGRQGISTGDIYLGPLPFIAMNVCVIGLLLAFPDLILPEPVQSLAPGEIVITPGTPATGDQGSQSLNHLFD